LRSRARPHSARMRCSANRQHIGVLVNLATDATAVSLNSWDVRTLVLVLPSQRRLPSRPAACRGSGFRCARTACRWTRSSLSRASTSMARLLGRRTIRRGRVPE
jgi:hypothetical protein